MKKRSGFSFLLLIVLGIVSCANGHSSGKKQNEPNRAFETGKVIPKVFCQKDPSTTYALYLPKKYSSSRTYPVILAFDPHGSGNLPLELYHGLAEKYGYIMIGSNESKNGIPVSESDRIIFSLFEEMNLGFSVDTNRIYTLGFSGGSRIASLIALFHGGVAGVIGCGAGFPGIDQPGKYRFDYIGFAGTYDFNMHELIGLDQQLDQQAFNHALFLFDGIHEWPSASLIEKAFKWNECCAMRRNSIPKDDHFINAEKQRIDSLLTIEKNSVDKIGYHRSLKNAISFMKDLSETDSYKKTLTDLEKNPGYKQQSRAQQNLLEKESKEQQELNDDFFFKDLDWWKSRIAGYDKRISSSKNPEDARMCRRLKSYLSLMCYMNYTRLQNKGDVEKAKFAMQVYEVVDPENAAKTK